MNSTLIWITCRNYENYLPEALMSAATQTQQCAIVVAHDDCGNGNPAGLSATRNRMLDSQFAMAAKYVVFLDADDILPTNYVEELTDVANGEDVIVTCPAELWGDQTGITHPVNPVTVDAMLAGNTIHCSALIPVKQLLRYGGYDEKLSAWEDWELWTKMCYYGVPFRTTSKTKLRYRRHAGSMNREFAHTMTDMQKQLQARYGHSSI